MQAETKRAGALARPALIAAVACVISLMAVPTAGASPRGCGLLGLFRCPPATTTVTSSGAALSLTAAENPKGLTAFPARTPGGPLYPLVRGRLPYGLNDNETSTTSVAGAATASDVADEAAAVGASWGRVPLYWPVVEPSNGRFDFSVYDGVYKSYIAAGIRPVFMVVSTPAWAVSFWDALTNCGGNYCTVQPQSSMLGAAYYLGQQLAIRYPLAAAFEWRNESNIPQGNVGAVPPAVYAQGVSAFGGGVHAGRPAMRVWGGSIVPNVDSISWLANFFNAGGATNIDALSFHPYPMNCDYIGEENGEFGFVHQAVVTAGLTSLRLVAGESGVPHSPTGGSCGFTDGPQPGGGESVFQRLKRYYDDIDRRSTSSPPLDAAFPGTDKLDGVVFYTAVDPASGPQWGWVLRPVGSAARKPRDVFCRWRTQVAGAGPFAGDSNIGACPGARRRRAKPKLKHVARAARTARAAAEASVR